MKMLLLACLVLLACACTPHEVRCDGRLEPINRSARMPGDGPGAGTGSSSGVP